ncbi:MAG: folate-binding protein [Castellaniella sp.]|uniref:CAF17-like 4Fe-4S cluster assembly/insertion protein YgfZ n=1 Tax=Castellaniella sp. TaxID=1955812 RepID=UPI003C71B4D4
MSISGVEGQWRLPEQAVIRLEGPDAVEFLHGQLSNAVQGLPDDQARPAGYCTAQGRLLANGILWSAGPQALDLMVSRDLAEGLLRRLRMFVLRAKVTLTLDDTRPIMGVCGASHMPTALHGLPAWSRRDVAGDTWIMAAHTSSHAPAAWRIAAPTAGSAPADHSPAADSDAWRAACLSQGWPWIRTASQDIFLPSALNMDLNGSIDFHKGCYPGQEVVARSHYRGTVKRRMAIGTAPWPAERPAPAAASDLYAAGGDAGRPVGRLIEVAVWREQLYAAAEITLSDWPAMTYAVGSPDGPVLTLQAPQETDASPA